MSYIENLPQFLWREVFVSSAHQIVVGEELEVGLRYLQALFLHILAREDVGIRQHVVVYQLADNLVREWETIARDDVEAVQSGTLWDIIWVLWRCDAMCHAKADVDACVWCAAYDDALLVFLREMDVSRQLETYILQESLQGLDILQEHELVAIALSLEQVVVVDALLMAQTSLL